MLSLKNYGARRYLQIVDHTGNPTPEKEKGMVLQRIRTLSRVNKILLSIPVILVLATVLASMERTPLTGRCVGTLYFVVRAPIFSSLCRLRFILLSPEEEDTIAKQLAGQGWFSAVGDILAKEEENPRFIPESDWRFAWVQDTLRRLERTIPMLAIEQELEPGWLDRPEDVPFPPPAEWPLAPRPRATESLRAFCNMLCENKAHRGPHSIPGPPYSLLIVENPEASNAFSYGFGPDGGGGVVIYSGFLDHILSREGSSLTNVPEPSTRSSSWFSLLFGALFPSSSQGPPHPTPTPEQTTDLAILLAHELAHLILSHHLESMSSSTIVIPSLVSIMADVVRVVLFPFTMLFGPFVNDAVAQLGQVGTTELAELSEMCANKSQEIEADVVSVRFVFVSLHFLFYFCSCGRNLQASGARWVRRPTRC
jgi:Zn-dependent protease with chaperone function